MAFFCPAAEKQDAEHRNNVFRTLHTRRKTPRRG